MPKDDTTEGELILKMPLNQSDRFFAIINAEEFKYVLQEVDNELRSLAKYSDEQGDQEFADRARELIWKHLQQRKLDIWEE